MKIQVLRHIGWSFLIFIIILFNTSYSQNGVSTNEQSFTKHILANSELGYITLLGGVGNIDPLWFEGVLVPSYSLRINKNAKWGAVLVPKIILRMYQEDSQPVNSPSYMPQISFYHQMNEPTNNFNNLFYLFGSIVHHSNGQAGNFYNDDGTLNTITGDFSTNYIEVGFFLTKLLEPKLNATEFFRSSLEIHPEILQYEALNNLYGNIRWHNDIQLLKIDTRSVLEIFTGNENTRTGNINESRPPTVRARINTTYIFGEMDGIDIFDFSKRLCISATLSFHPAFLQDLRVFAQYYYGQDYYNMNFQKTLSVLRFGLMVDPLNI